MFVFKPLPNSFVKGDDDDIISLAVFVSMVNDDCPVLDNGDGPVNRFPVVEIVCVKLLWL